MPHQTIYLYPLFLLILPHNAPPLAAALPPANSDAAALLSFKSAADPAGNHLHFPPTHNNNSSLAECSWPGVTCSPTNRVIRILLQNLGLDGTLLDSNITNLDQLRILSLKSNALHGPLPNLSSLANLKALFLSHNLFTGSFPLSLLSLRRLRTLDLSHNSFAGLIPAGLGSLDRLDALRLDSNLFSGRIPALNMSSLKAFNVSANELFGPVPVTVTFSSFGAAAFAENARLCGAVVMRECGSNLNFFNVGAAAPSPAVRVTSSSSSSATVGPNRGKHEKALIAVGFFVLAVVLVVLLVGVCLVVREKKKSGGIEKNVVFDEVEVNGERSAEEVEDRCNEVAAATAAVAEEKMKRLGRSGSLVFCAGESQVYNLEQLMRASAEMLGRGSLGSTYKAVLDNRLVLCVKRLDAGKIGLGGKEGFERHMEVVGRLRHPNLVPLRAFFQAKEERLLVYDYQPNGSLHSLIHGMISCLFLVFLLLHFTR